jgi:hypothetical protein
LRSTQGEEGEDDAAAMGEEKQNDERKNKYAVGCSIIGSIISVLMGYGKLH